MYSTQEKMCYSILTSKAPITTTADYILKYFVLLFRENEAWHFMCSSDFSLKNKQAIDWHDMLNLFFPFYQRKK